MIADIIAVEVQGLQRISFSIVFLQSICNYCFCSIVADIVDVEIQYLQSIVVPQGIRKLPCSFIADIVTTLLRRSTCSKLLCCNALAIVSAPMLPLLLL